MGDSSPVRTIKGARRRFRRRGGELADRGSDGLGVARDLVRDAADKGQDSLKTLARHVPDTSHVRSTVSDLGQTILHAAEDAPKSVPVPGRARRRWYQHCVVRWIGIGLAVAGIAGAIMIRKVRQAAQGTAGEPDVNQVEATRVEHPGEASNANGQHGDTDDGSAHADDERARNETT